MRYHSGVRARTWDLTRKKKTQGFVREEWAAKHNLPFFLSNDYQGCLDKYEFQHPHNAGPRLMG